MKINQFMITGILICAMGGGGAYAQSVGDEVVLTAGMFMRGTEGIVQEAGGHAGTGVQHGTLKFPWDKGPALVGITTALPTSWVGHDVDIVLGASTGGWLEAPFRIHGQVDNTGIGRNVTLGAEDWGTTEVTVVSGHPLSQRRFGMVIGRDPDHPADTTDLMMNFEYVVLRLVN